jgi:hypothetical protein
LAKKYCFACAYWNREEAKFCENCGAKLPVENIVPLQRQVVNQKQAGYNKWKAISAIFIGTTLIFSIGFLYYYNQLREEYNLLLDQYNSLNFQKNALISNYNILQNQYNDLQNRYNQLKSDYDINQLLAANKRLEDRLLYLQQEGFMLYNQSYWAFMFRYNNDMVKFITDIIQGDLGSDLYKIHSKWASIFQYSTEYDSEELI